MRHPEWPARLAAYLADVQQKPYHPVTHNCAIFALGALEAVTGRERADLMGGLELPESEFGVARVLAECGGVRGVATRAIGEMHAATLTAQRGDVALLDGDGGQTMGVVENGAVVVVTPQGLVRHPLKAMLGFWRV